MILLFSIAGKSIFVKEESKQLFIASKQSSFVFIPIEKMFIKDNEKEMIKVINAKIQELDQAGIKDYIINEMKGIGLTFIAEK